MPDQKRSKYFSVIQRGVCLLTYAIALMPVEPYIVNSIAMIAWCALLLFANLFFKNEIQSSKQTSSPRILFYLLSGNFLLFMISSLLRGVDGEAIHFLTGSSPMLIFPFFIFLFPFNIGQDKNFLNRILQLFWLGTLLLVLFLFYQFFELGYMSRLGEANSFNTLFRVAADTITGKHPSYIAIYLGFSIYIALYLFTRERQRLKQALLLTSIPLFVFMLLLMASRTPTLGIIAGLLIVSFVKIKSTAKKLIVLTTVVVLSALLIRFTPAIYSRVREVENTAMQPPVGIHYNSTNIRVGIYQCAWQLIKEHYLLGVGPGNDKKLLTACYQQYPTDAYAREYYNTHNEYLNIILLTGLFSLLLFLFSIIYLFRIAVKQRSYLLLFFMILMSISFFTENVLTRQAGVVFYYFFLSIILSELIRQRNTRNQPEDANGTRKPLTN